MNLAAFKSAFTTTARSSWPPMQGCEPGVPGLQAILDELGGCTFNHGLYRVLHGGQVTEAIQAMEADFPEYAGRILPFGFDWLGRHFAIDLARIEHGRPLVLMLEVGAGEAMEIPATVSDFHNVELVEHADDALALPFWRQWRHSYPADLVFTDCVGYKVPLFLGGPDTVDNLEVIDKEVYVEVCGQLRKKLRTLHPGQSIREITFDG